MPLFHSQTLYSALSSSYDLCSLANGHDSEAHYTIRRLGTKPRHEVHKVLSLGCGTGTFDAHVASRYPEAHITSMDMNPDMVAKLEAKAKKRGWHKRLHTMVGDVRELMQKIAGEKFDIIMATGLLEYIPEPAEVIGPSKEMLMDDGVFLNSVVRDTLCGKLVGKVAGMWPAPRADNIAMFTDQGFDLDHLIELPPYPHMWWIREVKEGHVFRKSTTSS